MSDALGQLETWMLRQTVVTIHGVNPDRTWQERVRFALEPHFRCESIWYDEYLGLRGPIKAVFNLWFIPLVLAGMALAVMTAVKGPLSLALVFAAFTLSMFALGLIVAYFQRRACVRRVKQTISDACRATPVPPHVVAHSFGSYLAGSILRMFPDVLMDRIVFVGSVLPRRFDWGTILREKPYGFRAVRNELGRRDSVVKLVRAVRWLSRDLGDAGVMGFVGDTNLIHDGATPWGPCELCVSGAEPARVHNVPLREFAHSDPLLGPDHAFRLWLPSLWGYSPRGFYDYLLLCWSAAYLEQEGRWADQADVVGKLCTSVWEWTAGAPLEAHVEREISAYLAHPSVAAQLHHLPGDIRVVAREAVRLIYLATTEAYQEMKAGARRAENVIRAIHPPTAVSRAVERTLGPFR